MTDLDDFLLARIAEDEADVAAILRQHPNWEADGDDVCDTPDLIVAHARGDYAAQHIARWDPARVLAECEAKRRLVRAYRSAVLDEAMWARHPDTTYAQAVARVSAWTFALQSLTAPYADHPDYRQEWRL